MKKFAVSLVAFILVFSLANTYIARAESGYWKLSSTQLYNSDPIDGEYWKNSVSAGKGGATFTTRGAQNEYSKTSTSWTDPPERLQPDVPFELAITAKVDALTNKAGSHVLISAAFDVPDLGLGYKTSERVYLVDPSGSNSCETVTESSAIIVSGSLGRGSVSGETRTLYIYSFNDGLEVQSQYLYTWIVDAPGYGDSGTRFSAISGTVEVASDEDFQLGIWRFAKMGDVLPVNGHIRTGEESSCILSFADMSTFGMKEDTHIVLTNPPDESKIAIVWGKIKSNVQKMIKDGSMEIDMSQAVAGIKGTTFVCEEDGATSTLKVLDGTVEFTSKATGESVMVGAGQQASATSSGLSPVTALDTSAEEAAWTEIDTSAGSNAENEKDTDTASDANDANDADWYLTHADAPVKYGILYTLAPFILGLVVIIIVAVVLIILARKKRRSVITEQIPPVMPPQTQSSQQTTAAFCVKCGSRRTPGGIFCNNCGNKHVV